MARDNLELSAWGDGTIRLSFWDSSAGNDRIFILSEDGQAYLHGYASDADDAPETRTPVDLVASLRALANARKRVDRE